MKYKSILFLVALINFSNGCSQFDKPVTKNLILAGRVINQSNIPTSDFIKVYYQERGYSKQEYLSSIVDSLGNFKTVLNLQYKGTVYLSYKDSHFNVIIHPGDSIYIVIDNNSAARPNHIKFLGNAAEINNKCYKFSLGIDSIRLYSHIYERYKTDSPIKFRFFADSLHKRIIEYKNNFIKNFSPDKELKDWINMCVLDIYTSTLFCYPNEHCIQNSMGYDSLDLSKDYFSFIDSIPTLKSDYLINSDISSNLPNYYLGFFIQLKVDKSNNWNMDDPKRDSLIIEGILKYSKHDDLLRQMLLNEFFSWNLNRLDTVFYIKNLEVSS